MEFTKKQKAWIMLIALVLGTGTTAGITAFLSGSNIYASVGIGIGVAATNVYTTLKTSPADVENKTDNFKPLTVGK